jgi:DNA-binding NtrC family response regulator
MTSILYIEDDEGLQSLVGHALKKDNYCIQNVATLSEARKVFSSDAFDIALVDYELPDGKGIEFVQENNKKVACIILTGVGNESLAVKCINEGAKDYIVKDFQGKYLEILPSIIERVLNAIRLENENKKQSKKLLKTQARLQAIFDNAPDLMMTTDSEFNIISVSEVISSQYNKNKKQVERKNLFDIIDKKHFEQLDKNKNVFFKAVFLNESPILVKCISLNLQENLIVFRNLEEHLKAQEAVEKLQLVEKTNNQLKEKNQYLEKTLRCYSEKNLLGQSAVMFSLRKTIQSVAVTEATVVISGETGTGKELVADAIVRLSCRSEKPMITLNCASIPKELVESELFGHEKGAFTGALKQYNGKFSQADGGTLFLDEVGELDISTQAKLLRVLQEGEIQPVGSPKNKIVDVRVIAATNRNLEDMVAKGLFREDLFYRLNVVPIKVPPLRERKEDIVLLSQFFLKKYAHLYSISERDILDSDAKKLIDYPWPGNVRELQNAIERFLILGDFLFLTPPSILEETAFENILIDDEKTGSSSTTKNSLGLLEVEKKHIEDVLSLCNGVVSGNQGAAKKLGLNPSTLRFKIKKLNIKKQ